MKEVTGQKMNRWRRKAKGGNADEWKEVGQMNGRRILVQSCHGSKNVSAQWTGMTLFLFFSLGKQQKRDTFAA